MYSFQEFRKAVDAWRNRGKESNDRKMSTPLTEKVSIQLENISINGNRNDGKKNAVGASVSALAIAAKIEKEFENEQLMFQLKIKEQKGLLHASFKTKEEMKKKEMMKKREDKKEEEEENGDTGKEMEEDEYEKIDSVRADDKCCSYRGSVRGSENSDSEEDSFYNNVTEAKYSSHSADPGRTTGASLIIFYLLHQ